MIERIEAIPVAYTEPNDHGRLRYILVVRVRTADGLCGWGEAVTMTAEGTSATKALIDGWSDLIVGADPLEPATLRRTLAEHAWWYASGGLYSLAVAALDIALWDLKGKVLGRPVLDLLGGPVHDRLPAMVSCHADKADLAETAGDIADWLSEGACGVKIGFGKLGDAGLGADHDRDVEFVRLVREAVGERALLMVDLGVKVRWSVAEAVRRTRAFEEYGLEWIEEPLGDDHPEGYRTLRDKTTTKIAYGEREWNTRGIRRILDTGTVDVLGVDPGRAEGITGFLQAAALAERDRVQINAHAWSGGIVQAASVTCSFAAPTCRLLEVRPLPVPVLDELTYGPVRPDGGQWARPDKPGLGVEVDEAVLARLRADR